MEAITNCGHCEGTGVCTRGKWANSRVSCDSCQSAAGHSGNMGDRILACNICNGTGWVRIR